MDASQTLFLAEIAAGHSGPTIPASKRAYFQERLRIRIFNFLLEKFLLAQETGLTKAILARRIGKTSDVVNRWLGAPSNLQLDTLSDLLLGIAAEELEPTSFSPLAQMPSNYSHYEELHCAPKNEIESVNASVQRAEDLSAGQQSRFGAQGAHAASVSNYEQQRKATIPT